MFGRFLIVLTAVSMVIVCPQAQAAPKEGTPAAKRGCDTSYTYKAAKRGLRASLKHHQPMSKAAGRKAWRYVVCTRSRDATRGLRRLRRSIKKWRQAYENVWVIRFNALPSWDQAWAYSTGACESGNNPATNTGNSFSGAFQFLPSTWWAAGGTGMPHQHSWHYQAWIAVHWMHKAGASQWPVCGV